MMDNKTIKKRAAFIDRDGVINEDKKYLFRQADIEYIPGSKEALKILSARDDILIVIVTGQSGIGRGKYTEADFWKLMDWMKNDLATQGIRLDGIYFCPHPDRDDLYKAIPPYNVPCDCRKPRIGMIKQALAHFNEREIDVDLKKSCCFGDKTAEVKMAENAGCLGVLVKTGYGGNEPKDRYPIKPDYIATNLLDAVRWWLSRPE